MTGHAIGPFASRQTISSHYIASQTDAKRLTKTRHPKTRQKIFAAADFLPSWGSWANGGFARGQDCELLLSSRSDGWDSPATPR